MKLSVYCQQARLLSFRLYSLCNLDVYVLLCFPSSVTLWAVNLFVAIALTALFWTKYHIMNRIDSCLYPATQRNIVIIVRLIATAFTMRTTLRYTQLIDFDGEEYSSAVAKSVDEAQKLVEAGFEYVTTFDSIMVFRKRKQCRYEASLNPLSFS